jgi:hypothetical protein
VKRHEKQPKEKMTNPQNYENPSQHSFRDGTESSAGAANSKTYGAVLVQCCRFGMKWMLLIMGTIYLIVIAVIVVEFLTSGKIRDPDFRVTSLTDLVKLAGQFFAGLLLICVWGSVGGAIVSPFAYFAARRQTQQQNVSNAEQLRTLTLPAQKSDTSNSG